MTFPSCALITLLPVCAGRGRLRQRMATELRKALDREGTTSLPVALHFFERWKIAVFLGGGSKWETFEMKIHEGGFAFTVYHGALKFWWKTPKIRGLKTLRGESRRILWKGSFDLQFFFSVGRICVLFYSSSSLWLVSCWVNQMCTNV